MKLALESGEGQYAIRAHQRDAIQVNETLYRSSLIVTPRQLVENWGPTSVLALTAAVLEPVLTLDPEVILIGTGDRLVFPSLEIRRFLAETGVGFEFMDTGAACRTYNVLMAESRRVVAGLIIQPDGAP